MWKLKIDFSLSSKKMPHIKALRQHFLNYINRVTVIKCN